VSALPTGPRDHRGRCRPVRQRRDPDQLAVRVGQDLHVDAVTLVLGLRESKIMNISLLGPVEVRDEGGLVSLPQPRQRAVVAALAVDVGQPVLIDALIDRVWGEQPPRQVRQALYGYVSQLRRTLTLVRRSGGYVLQLDADRVDVHRFRRLVSQAREPACPASQRVALLRDALRLWRGAPLSDLPGEWAARTRESWHQEHVDAAIAWAHAEMYAGDPDRAVEPLAALVEDHSLNESLTAALMLVLYAAGRTADALARYADIRDHLAEQLGTDPGPELEDVHRAIRQGDVSRQPQPASPAQLPVDVHRFTGRREQLAALDAFAAPDDQPSAALITAVSGPAGVGKTALALHWAHRVRHRFPDGQLYVDLRGFDPGGSAMSPAEAIRLFLEALHVPAERIPTNVDARAALYRTLMADKRVLVVLDNARDADQVRPLLPGSPGCLVLVTSRNRLTSLIAAEGARSLPLDLLTVDEARDLLVRRLGEARAAAEPDAVDEIVGLCTRLPLALAVVAANARPGLALATVADELRGARRMPDALSTGDGVTQGAQ
jgi:DNA-binding SARP family transcriptional activator